MREFCIPKAKHGTTNKPCPVDVCFLIYFSYLVIFFKVIRCPFSDVLWQGGHLPCYIHDLQTVDVPSFSIARCDVWNIIHHFHGHPPRDPPCHCPFCYHLLPHPKLSIWRLNLARTRLRKVVLVIWQGEQVWLVCSLMEGYDMIFRHFTSFHISAGWLWLIMINHDHLIFRLKRWLPWVAEPPSMLAMAEIMRPTVRRAMPQNAWVAKGDFLNFRATFIGSMLE